MFCLIPIPTILKRFVDLVISLPFASDRAVRDDANAPSADYVITRVELVASLSRGVSEESMSKDLLRCSTQSLFELYYSVV